MSAPRKRHDQRPECGAGGGNTVVSALGARGVGMSTENIDRAGIIRTLNDHLRTTFTGGRVMLTAGVDALPLDVKGRVILAVRSFSNFTKDNDPHGEHDFGAFEIDGQRFFWKIDYYNLDLDGGSEDPADPEQTSRVLTIMFVEEY